MACIALAIVLWYGAVPGHWEDILALTTSVVVLGATMGCIEQSWINKNNMGATLLVRRGVELRQVLEEVEG